MSDEIRDIKVAILGNQLSQERGLLWRLARLEEKNKEAFLMLDEINKDKVKNSVYLRQISFVTGGLILSIIGLLVKQILN